VPEFLPFAGIRYDLEGRDTCLDAVTAPPYDVIDDDARARLEAADARNAVHLILPRDARGEDRYTRAAVAFQSWLADGTLVRDRERFYRYRMTFIDDDHRPRHTLGVIGALELSPPGEGSVLPHERTMPKPKSDRLDLLRAVRHNLDPVWGLSLGPLTAAIGSQATVLAECRDPDGVVHELAAIDDPDAHAAITAAVAAAPLVIADGHHRYETALAYRAEQHAAGAGPGPHDQILAFVVELIEDELSVRPIHRLLAGLGGADVRALAAEMFTVTDAGPNTPEGVDALRLRMAEEGALGLADRAGLSVLVPRPDRLAARLEEHPAVVRAVDATICDVGILAALPSADVAYRNDAQVVAGLVAKGDIDAAVLLKPVTVSQIHDVAVAGERMPEKSSFFAPKPLTGLVFRSL